MGGGRASRTAHPSTRSLAHAHRMVDRHHFRQVPHTGRDGGAAGHCGGGGLILSLSLSFFLSPARAGQGAWRAVAIFFVGGLQDPGAYRHRGEPDAL